ncbi:S38A9 protein, partial [Polypterus senegalus]
MLSETAGEATRPGRPGGPEEGLCLPQTLWGRPSWLLWGPRVGSLEAQPCRGSWLPPGGSTLLSEPWTSSLPPHPEVLGGRRLGKPECFRVYSRHFRHTGECPRRSVRKNLEPIRACIKRSSSLHSMLDSGEERTKQEKRSGGGLKKEKGRVLGLSKETFLESKFSPKYIRMESDFKPLLDQYRANESYAGADRNGCDSLDPKSKRPFHVEPRNIVEEDAQERVSAAAAVMNSRMQYYSRLTGSSDRLLIPPDHVLPAPEEIYVYSPLGTAFKVEGNTDGSGKNPSIVTIFMVDNPDVLATFFSSTDYVHHINVTDLDFGTNGTERAHRAQKQGYDGSTRTLLTSCRFVPQAASSKSVISGIPLRFPLTGRKDNPDRFYIVRKKKKILHSLE